jgi:hypothetical protein
LYERDRDLNDLPANPTYHPIPDEDFPTPLSDLELNTDRSGRNGDGRKR